MEPLSIDTAATADALVRNSTNPKPHGAFGGNFACQRVLATRPLPKRQLYT